ncbi:MAG: PHP domain-containing protein [Kiritimatiellae bacterium]|nr:PHP domain-containing protein [Kiritimatiellia bacterium]MDW8458619.1 PHP domain-containing protein [Verrucomicrobiota bacterium]
MHSTFSDGSKTPEELVARGSALGLRGMALTDHDTVSGVERFLNAARAAGIPAVSGVEVSAQLDGGSVHVLGYGIDPTSPALREALGWIREGRSERNREIIHKLNRLGFRITEEEVAAAAGGEVVGRPHIAGVLVRKGIVHSKREAFDRFLGRGRPAFAERRRLDPVSTIRLIRESGGVAVIAHPYALKMNRRDLAELLRELHKAGLTGIEVYYPEHSPETVRAYRSLAAEIGLLVTGGSDYHGEAPAEDAPGRRPEHVHVPIEVWEPLLAAIQSVQLGCRLAKPSGPDPERQTPSP